MKKLRADRGAFVPEARFIVMERGHYGWIASGDRMMTKDQAETFIKQRYREEDFSIYELVPLNPSRKRGKRK